MSLLRRIKQGAASTRDVSTLADPSPQLVTALTGGRTFSGQSVSAGKALGLPAFWRGVHLLSGAVGMMPCKVYQRTDGARVEASRTSRPWRLLHERPNDNMAADEYWSLVEAHLKTWGNSWSYKEYGGDGRIGALWPLNPKRVKVGQRKDGSLYYVVDGDTDNELSDREILHFRGLSPDGVVGYSPVQLHRQTLGSGLARQEFEGRFWDEDATPNLVLIHPGKIGGGTQEQVDTVKARWEAHHRGRGRHRVAVLQEDMKVEQLSMPLDDAQFIEQKKYGATEIGLILGLPPHMVGGDSGGSLDYSNTEARSLDLLKWTLSPDLVRMQNVATADKTLMPESWFCEFETGAVLRSTTKERYDAWAVAPHLTVDEMRAMDNLPPLPDGKGEVLAKVVVAEAATKSGGVSDGVSEPEGGDQE